MILTALRPLMQVDLSRLPDLVTGLTRSEREEAARERNDALLRSLVESQTAEWIEGRAGEFGLAITAKVTAAEAEGGSFVPVSAALTGAWTPKQREIFSAVLSEELAIPPERQRWVGG